MENQHPIPILGHSKISECPARDPRWLPALWWMVRQDTTADYSPSAERLIKRLSDLATDLGDLIEDAEKGDPTEAEIAADLEEQGGSGFVRMTAEDEHRIKAS